MTSIDSKPFILFPKNSLKVIKSSHYGQIFQSLEEVEFASVMEDRGSSFIVEFLLDEHTLEFEIVEEGVGFSDLSKVLIKPDEPYYGLRLLERTIEVFKGIGIMLTMTKSTKNALDIWQSFRETTPKVDENLRPIIFPLNMLAICVKLNIVEQQGKDVFFL